MEDKVKKNKIITNLCRRNGQREWLLQTFVEMVKKNKIKPFSTEEMLKENKIIPNICRNGKK